MKIMYSLSNPWNCLIDLEIEGMTRLPFLELFRRQFTRIDIHYCLERGEIRTRRDSLGVFSSEYSPMSEQIKHAINKCWHILEVDVDLKEKTMLPPLISFRRTRNLRDELVRRRFVDKKNVVRTGLKI